MLPTVDICLLFLQNVPTDARTLNIARSLHKAGFRVAVIGWGNAAVVERWQKAGVLFQLFPQPSGKRLLFQWLTFLYRAVREVPKAHVYWAEDLYTLPLALWLRYRQKARAVVYDARELFFALASLAHRPWTQRFWERLERRSLPFVDGLLVSGPKDLAALAEHYGMLPERTLVLYNFPPYRPKQRTNYLRQRLGLAPDQPIVIYQGMLLAGRGIEHVIAALPHLPNWHFVLFGNGPAQAKLQQLAQSLQVADRCTFLGTLPYEKLLAWTASADVGVALIEPRTQSYQLALPNKVFEYCQARIPVLATNLPAMAEMIHTHQLGKTISPTAAPEEIAHHLQQLYQWSRDPAWQARCERAARQLCWEQQEHSLIAWAQQFLSHSHSSFTPGSTTQSTANAFPG